MGFTKALNYTERIRKILQTEVSSQLAGGNSMIRNTELFDQFFFDSIIRTDIMDIVIQFFETRQ